MYLTLVVVVAASSVSAVRPRVFGGEDDVNNAFPFAVSIEYSQEQVEMLDTRICSASLLTPIWALTAGHCLEPMQYLGQSLSIPKSIRYGDFEKLPNETKKFCKVLKEFTHPLFTHRLGRVVLNDIALMLVEVVPRGAFVKLSVVDYRSLAGQRGRLAGFSPMIYNPDNLDEVTILHTRPLQVLDVMISNCECLKEYGDRYDRVLGPVMCVTGKCGAIQFGTPGDSGGPLVHDGRVVGVASVGPPKPQRGAFAAAYTPVSPFINWIREVIAENSLQQFPGVHEKT